MQIEHAVKLSDLPMGHSGTVVEIHMEDGIKRRLLDLGLVRDSRIRALNRSPAGDPVAFEVRGAVIALRNDVASHILVTP